MKRTICLIAISLIAGCISYQEQIHQRRQQYVIANPRLPDQIANCILAGKIVIGMTKQQVRASSGNPTRINRSVSSWGVHEQWVYKYETWDDYPTYSYLYFKNGMLTSWQN